MTELAMSLCPLTGSRDVEVLEEMPASLLIDAYRRDLRMEVAAEFDGIEKLRLCRCPASGIIYFDPPVMGSTDFYERLRAFDWYHPRDKFEFRLAARWMPAVRRVLDVGCGPGHFAAWVPHADYTGLENGPSAVALARAAGLSVDQESLADHAAGQCDRYDAVCAFQVLEHLADPGAFVTEALACLRPGGILVFGVPNADSYVTGLANFVLNAPPHHVTWWNERALRSLASQFGLQVLTVAPAPVEPWEARLYWTARIVAALGGHGRRRFPTAIHLRLITGLSYLTAGPVGSLFKPDCAARGATIVLVARKGGELETRKDR